MSNTAALFWYSQTGHSYACGLKARDALESDGWKVSVVPMKNATPADFEADILLYAFPVHSFQVPVMVKKWIAAMDSLKTPKPAFAVLTYAGAAVNTDWMLKQMLAGKNIQLIDYILIRCRDSYIPFAKWLPLLNRKENPNARSFQQVEKFIQKRVLNRKREKRPIFNPVNPLHWIGAVSPENGPKMLLGKRIYREEACVKCGICASLCPSGAITMKDNEIQYRDNLCIGCCGCMNVCPSSAWVSSWFAPAIYNKGMHVKEMAEAMSENRKQKDA